MNKLLGVPEAGQQSFFRCPGKLYPDGGSGFHGLARTVEGHLQVVCSLT